MEEKKLPAAEALKLESNYLRGTLEESLRQDSTHFDKDEVQLLKFHGSYQQDDRDLRMKLVKEKKEKAFSMMIRSKIPGGRMSAEQYLMHDELSEKYGNSSMRVTTRQGIQFHGVLKKNAKAVIRGINEKLGTTSGACGDIVRNVMASTVPLRTPAQLKIYEYAKKLSDQFLAQSNAYHEIWLDGEKVADEASKPVEEVEPIYGKTYLPRKFKIAITYPEDNHVDVYANDLGIVPEMSASGELEGFNILVGGGMGMTHGIEKTYPRLATPLCFVKPDDVFEISKAIVLVQRDNGNRVDRKQARLKYLIDGKGLDWFRAQVEKRFGKKTDPARPIKLAGIENYLGWHEQVDGKWFYGVFVENGRIIDRGSSRIKSGLRKAVEKFGVDVYLSAQHDVILSGFEAGQKEDLESILTEYGITLSGNISNVRRDSMACPALPTCGLAISESERAMPHLIDRLEEIAEKLELLDQKFIIRMTGCPNGCARPYNAEIAFVGRTAGTYNIYVGGNLIGDRMAELLAEKIPFEELPANIEPLWVHYREHRLEGEAFGDFAYRIGTQSLKTLLPQMPV